jgi:hypothetical protein
VQDFLDFSHEDACVVLYTSEVMVEEEIEIEPTPRDELQADDAPPKSDDGGADAEGAAEGEDALPAEGAAPAEEQAQAQEGGEGAAAVPGDGEGGEEGEALDAVVEEKVVAPAEPKYEKIWVSKKKVHLSYHHLPDREDQIAYFLIRNRCAVRPVQRKAWHVTCNIPPIPPDARLFLIRFARSISAVRFRTQIRT